MKVMKERSQSRSAVGQIAKLKKPCLEFSNLDGCRPHIPWGQVHGMSGIAREMGHCVFGGAAVGAGGVIGPAYGLTVGHKPRTMAGTGAVRGRSDMIAAAVVWLGQLEGGGEPGAPCWMPGARWSPLSSGPGGGVWPGGKRPLPSRPRR